MAHHGCMIRESAQDGFEDSSSGPGQDSTPSYQDRNRRSGLERRAAFRARTLVSAKLLVGDDLADCIVRNLSVRGAQVRVLGETEALPSTVALLLTSEGLLLDATIIWRNGDKIGVTFTGHHDLSREGDAGCAAARALWQAQAPR